MAYEIIKGYCDDAEMLIPRYEAISCSDLYAHVADLLPQEYKRVLDVEAGTGRDGAWFTSKGCQALAVEPVDAFREAGSSYHPSSQIEWLDDSLPYLTRVLARNDHFDFVMLSGVWQHLDSEQRCIAMPRLRLLMAPAGRLLISVRHGPGALTRHCFPTSAEETVALAQVNGLGVVLWQEAESIQTKNRKAGVTWTWLVFEGECNPKDLKSGVATEYERKSRSVQANFVEN